ncbi:MAG: beta-galactosidase [Eubacteriales bacterium]|nr:beta-galactosidase [Eubacteriales bacterium]
MDAVIRIPEQGRSPKLLPMEGTDSRGNLYQVDNISFLKNGKRFFPIMGEFHFSRYEPEAWEEELLKMRAGGIGILATYVFWIHHEEREGEWDFSGCRDLRRFLQICRKIDLPVWLRIGPWAHGECRNGGFPDWLVKDKAPVRTDDPVYLERVRRFWEKLGQQAQGMMAKDGGPVLGLQLENEYGHCGGPSDREEGMRHMLTLKRMAKEAGFVVPYYTATGWGGAYAPDREVLPVLGGYVDAPWAEHVDEMPASANFLFSAYKEDSTIGSDLKVKAGDDFTFDTSLSPYLTAELGGGLQVTSHRRTYPYPEDIEAQALCMMGGGANLLGYYMYHGGINPDGKASTLQETRATGYNNDLPAKSYDFQTCIGESGELRPSFGRLKKPHLLAETFGEELAGSLAFFAEKQPESPEDLHTLRTAARLNPETGEGFLFLNNHQRKRRMEEHRDASVEILWGEKRLVIDHLAVRDGECRILPFRFCGEKDGASGLSQTDGASGLSQTDGASLLPRTTNASLLCRIGQRLFFWSGAETPCFDWADVPKEVRQNTVVLTAAEANRAFLIGDKLYLTEREDSCLIEREGRVSLLSKAAQETLTVYGASGEPSLVRLEAAGAVSVPACAELVCEERDGDGTLAWREYRVTVGEVPEALHQLYLETDYAGDRAEVYLDGKLADDWFTTGQPWHMSLRRFHYPGEVTIRIYPTDKPLHNPYGDRVYYDLPVPQGCELYGVRTVPEYRMEL